MIDGDKHIWSKKFVLEDRLVDFAATIMDLVESLPTTRTGIHIGSQLLRSGSSPAANYAEAISAESRRDFIHKLGIAAKELRETFVWLRIIKRRSYLTGSAVLEKALGECNELIAIIVSSINTATKNLGRG
jgi:four helix bundle protein